MRQKLKNQLSLLLFFDKAANIKQQLAIIKNLNDIQLKTISELALNVIKGGIPVTDTDKQRLKRHVKTLRKLADRDVVYSKKRGLITRKLLMVLAQLSLPVIH
jgi:hypothetical protein